MQVHAVRSWVDRRNGVVTVTDDVQNVVRDLHELSDRIIVYYNEQTNQFDLVEKCLDGGERLIFSVDKLDQRVVHRMRAADHWHGRETPDHVLGDGEDFVSRIDAHNDALNARADELAMEKVKDAGLRYAWAMDLLKDQNSPGGQILIPKDI